MTTNILIIDDDTDFTEILSQSLERQNYPNQISHNAQDALTKASQTPFTHATLDLNLDQTFGIDLIPKLLEISPNLIIIVITGYASLATAVEAIKKGATHYLPKPIRAKDIIALLDPSKGHPNLTPKFNNASSLETLEWEHIQTTLQNYDYNISKTAEHLGLSRRTLQRKLKKNPL
jgi:two-component system response regulator RegA